MGVMGVHQYYFLKTDEERMWAQKKVERVLYVLHDGPNRQEIQSAKIKCLLRVVLLSLESRPCEIAFGTLAALAQLRRSGE